MRALIFRLRRKSQPADEGAVHLQRSPWLVWVGVLAALASLFSLLCLAVIVLVPNLIYFPWPRPCVDLLWWQFALMDLPFASLLLAGGLALLVGLSIRSSTWTRAIRWYYTVVGLVLLVFNLMILI